MMSTWRQNPGGEVPKWDVEHLERGGIAKGNATVPKGHSEPARPVSQNQPAEAKT